MTQAQPSWSQLDAAALQRELHRCPGLIPIELDLAQRQLHWQDLGQYHFYQGFYHKELALCQRVVALDRAHPSQRFVTDLDPLLTALDLQDAMMPTGLIFHAGRCGSSLLSRALAQSRAHLVWGEAQPHNALLALLTAADRRPMRDDAQALALFRQLVLAMGRKRLPTYQAHFIKFTSYQMLNFALLQQAFPTVPKLFLYRDPAAVLVSYLENPPGWALRNASAPQHGQNGEPTLPQRATDPAIDYSESVARFFQAALATEPTALYCLNYNLLCAEKLPAILSCFGVEPTAAQLTAMQTQFQYDAKNSHQWRAFVADDHAKRAKVTPTIAAQVEEKLMPLYRQLEARQRMAPI